MGQQLKVSYDPDIFNGLMMRIYLESEDEKTAQKVTVLIFSSGSVIQLGAKNEEHNLEAFKKLDAFISLFEKSL